MILARFCERAINYSDFPGSSGVVLRSEMQSVSPREIFLPGVGKFLRSSEERLSETCLEIRDEIYDGR